MADISLAGMLCAQGVMRCCIPLEMGAWFLAAIAVALERLGWCGLCVMLMGW